MAETARLLVERGKPHRFVISVCMGYIEVCNKTEVHENSRFFKDIQEFSFRSEAAGICFPYLLLYKWCIYDCKIDCLANAKKDRKTEHHLEQWTFGPKWNSLYAKMCVEEDDKLPRFQTMK